MPESQDDKVDNALGDISSLLTDIASEFLAIGVPGGSVIAKSYQLISAVKARRFAKKLKAFLEQPSKIDEKARKKFEERLCDDKEAFMDELVEAIDAMESEIKANMLGKVFSAHVANIINLKELNLMKTVIRASLSDDLEYFTNEFRGVHLSSDQRKPIETRLEAIGLLTEKNLLDFKKAKRMKDRMGGDGHPKVEYAYERNDNGKLLLNILTNSLDELKKYDRKTLQFHVIKNLPSSYRRK